MRLLPAHLAFIFVAKEYPNRAEAENRFVVLGPGGRGVVSGKRNLHHTLISVFPGFQAWHITVICGLSLLLFSCKESILIGLAIAISIVLEGFSLSKCRSRIVRLWKSRGHPDLQELMGWLCRQSVTDAPPKGEQRLPSTKWVIDLASLGNSSWPIEHTNKCKNKRKIIQCCVK